MEANLERPVLPAPSQENLKAWHKNRKRTQTVQHKRQQKLAAVEKELHRLQNDKRAKPDN